MTRQRPLISVVIPTKNRAPYLEKALRALGGQTLDRELFEVIVADDGSSDDTASVVSLFGERLALKYMPQQSKGIAEAKNYGLTGVEAPLVLFLDDDDVAHATLLEEHIATHRRHPEMEAAVLGRTDLSSEVRQWPLMRFVTETGGYLFSYYKIADGQSLDYTFFWGGRSSCKTSLLAERPVFQPEFAFGCEDIELGFRLAGRGLRVIYNALALSTMVRRASFTAFCERVERQGRANVMFYARHPVEEVKRWGDLVDVSARWERIGKQVPEVFEKARRLDEIASLRIREGLDLRDFPLEELHRAYWAALDAARLKGIWEESRRLGLELQ